MVWLRTFTLALFAALACQQAVGETVLLEFTTQNCGPCRRMRPVVQQLAAEGYAVREVDASSEPRAADQYRVTKFPTFLVLVDRREYARLEGGTDHRTLVEMIHRATAIAAQQRQSTSADPTVAFVGTGAETVNPFAQTQQPIPGRVTQLGGDPPVVPAAATAAVASPFTPASASSPGPPPTQPNAGGFAGAGAMPGQPSGGAAKLVDATVRLSIADAQGKCTGTGTIIDARQGKALVLTCGHLFRESKGQGVVDVTLFRNGPQGAEPIGSAQAQVIDFDLDRDLALICFETTSPVAVTPLAPRGSALAVEAPVTSVGCGHGANPTPWETRITAVNRYQGHANVEAARAPEEGRSGGGLFNAAGQLIGVCFAADTQGNEGLYASIDSIYQKLDALNLTATLQTPPSAAPQPMEPAPQPQVAVAPAPFEVRGQSPTPPPSAIGADAANPFANASNPQDASGAANASLGQLAANSHSPTIPASAQVDPSTLAPEERAAIQEIGRRAGNSEVIVIIRPHDAAAPSDVIKLKTASPEFVQTLEAAARPNSSAGNMAAQPGSSFVR
jgi:thiol-disulfide isomerase/thioredoxin